MSHIDALWRESMHVQNEYDERFPCSIYHNPAGEGYGYFEYRLTDDGTITIVRYFMENESLVIIPRYIDDIPVVHIGNYAFFHCGMLLRIELPDTVRTIGRSAFCLCANLYSMTVPDGVTSLEDEVFKGCFAMEYVYIPESVKRIGKRVFQVCDNLKEIILPKGIRIIDEEAFLDCDAVRYVKHPMHPKHRQLFHS